MMSPPIRLVAATKTQKGIVYSAKIKISDDGGFDVDMMDSLSCLGLQESCR